MTRAERIRYLDPEIHDSGMVVEEVDRDATPGMAKWPLKAARFEVPPGSATELVTHQIANTSTGPLRHFSASWMGSSA